MKKIIFVLTSLVLIALAFSATQPGFIQTLKGIYGVSTGYAGFGMIDPGSQSIMLSWPQGNNWVWLTLNQNGKQVGDLMSKAGAATSSSYTTMAEYVRDLESTGWRYMKPDELQPLSGTVRGLLAWLGIPGFAGLGGGAWALKRRGRK